MRKQLCVSCVGLAALAILYCTSISEAAQPNAPDDSATTKTGQRSKNVEKECEDEWKANRDAMMKGGMTEDSYVRQCVVRDDVPTIPEPKPKAAPSSTPK
jgi:hypothetical protein